MGFLLNNKLLISKMKIFSFQSKKEIYIQCKEFRSKNRFCSYHVFYSHALSDYDSVNY